MSLAAVIKTLQRAGIQATGLEIAEALWLAQHMTAVPAPVTAAPEQRSAPLTELDGAPAESAAAPASPSTEPVALSTANPSAPGSPVRGYPVDIPDIPGLSRREDIQRALRPLRLYGPSARRRVIDEDATVTFIANTGLWTPVLRPARERRFDVVLAVDSSPSMDLWRPLVRDLRAVLATSGAFRDIRTWSLRPHHSEALASRDPGIAARNPRELIDGTGRRVFLVVTDGAAQGWHDGSAAAALTDWSKSGPVAVLQPLPEEMWIRTGLHPARVRLSASSPGARNDQLRTAYRGRRRLRGIPVPVLGIEPNALHSWARLMTGSVSGVPLAATSVGVEPPPLLLPAAEDRPDAALDQFRASASPQAYKLAVFLSAVPLSLPVMRLVQYVADPASETSALAEAILGGLLSRTGSNTYEFLPGVREALLSELSRSELAMVLSAVADYIAEHVGPDNRTFTAIAERDDGPLAAGAEAFGWVPPVVAARLGLPVVSNASRDRPASSGLGADDQAAAENASPNSAAASATGTSPAGSTDVAAPTVDPKYLDQVRQIAPAQLLGRDDELTTLGAFCTQPGGGSYLWWKGAPWAGKSALMSWFVLHPPAGVQVASFFVTARLAGQNGRDAFLQAVLEQLAEITGKPLPAAIGEAAKLARLSQLMNDAAVTCQRRKQRLVLVVDGIDDDQAMAGAPDGPSIAGLLPALPPAGLRVIVTSRSGWSVPADVPGYHPLRDPAIVRTLDSSPSSLVIRSDAERELDRLMDGSPVERDVLGLLAAARGGLSARDLAELTGKPAYSIAETLRGVGRALTFRPGIWGRAPSSPVYALAHESLLEAAVASLGSESLARYQLRLNAWADSYRRIGWPPETPEYLLHGYFWLLASLADLSRMTALSLDAARQERLLEATGSDEVALTQIMATAEAVAQGQGNLSVMAGLAACLERIERRNPSVPASLPAAWAAAGQADRAQSLAYSISEPQLRAEALVKLMRTFAVGGQYERAEAVTASVADPGERAQLLIQLSVALREAGGYDRADALLADVVASVPVTDPSAVALTLRALHEAGAADQIAALLARDPAASVALDGGGVSALLGALTLVHASQQYDALVSRRPAKDTATSSRGSYRKAISRAAPGCLIILLDRSDSMGRASGQGQQTMAEAAAEAVDMMLMELCVRATVGVGTTRHNFDVGVFGYGARLVAGGEGVESAYGGELAGRELVPLPEIAAHPAGFREISSPGPDGSPVQRPTWIAPAHGFRTSMCEAIDTAGALAFEWIQSHPDSFPPVVINITDGFVTDSPYQGASLADWVGRLVSLATSDGDVLFFNIFLSPTATTRNVRFPSTADGLPDPLPQLFGVSSVLPPVMVANAHDRAIRTSPGARGFGVNISPGELTSLLTGSDTIATNA